MKNLKKCLRGLTAIYVLTSGMIFGADWRPIHSGLPVTSTGVRVLTVDPKTPASAIDTRTPVTALAISRGSATLYAATSGDGVYKSSDGGASWAPFNDG